MQDLELPPAQYGVIITRRDVDRFEHNALFAHELAVAMRQHGMPVRSLDFLLQAPELFAALRDPSCTFMVCFNGFGSELMMSPSLSPAVLTSAFTAFNKPLLDLMHDCPAHDAMRHQWESTFPQRILLLTDHGYAHLARSMGFPNVGYVPSMTFPATMESDPKPIKGRKTQILLSIGLAAPNLVVERFRDSKGYKDRVYSSLFDAVTSAAIPDWRIDPLAELLKACRQCDCDLDFRSADCRFLLTAVLDYVKFARRRNLLRAVAHLPITVISDREPDEEIAGNKLTFAPQCSATELLHRMEDSQCVICPTPHMTGFHERAMGAFTAGAVVISPPNEVIETSFVAGKEYVYFRNEAELAGTLEAALSAPGCLQPIATAGRERAMAMFHPARLAAVFLSLLTTRGM